MSDIRLLFLHAGIAKLMSDIYAGVNGVHIPRAH